MNFWKFLSIHIDALGPDGTPQAYQWFHLTWMVMTFLIAGLLVLLIKKPSWRQVKLFIFIFWIYLLTIEIFKQVYAAGLYSSGYALWATPAVLCSIPLYLLPIHFFIKNRNNAFNKVMLNYNAIFCLYSGAFVMFYPGDVFTSAWFLNFHTTTYHGSLFIIGFFLIARSIVKYSAQAFLWAILIFTIIYGFIILGNEIIYQVAKARNNGIVDSSKYAYEYKMPNLFNMSHRFKNPMVGELLPKFSSWSLTILYIPFTYVASGLIYTVFGSINPLLRKAEKPVGVKVLVS